MNPLSHATHDLKLDELETQQGYTISEAQFVGAAFIGVVAVFLLAIVGGVTVTQHLLAWTATW